MQHWQVVTEEQVRESIQTLQNGAQRIADATRERAVADESRKITLSINMRPLLADGTAYNRAETEARADELYEKAVKAWANAEAELAQIKVELKAAETIVEAWRTQCSNERAAR